MCVCGCAVGGGIRVRDSTAATRGMWRSVECCRLSVEVS